MELSNKEISEKLIKRFEGRSSNIYAIAESARQMIYNAINLENLFESEPEGT